MTRNYYETWIPLLATWEKRYLTDTGRYKGPRLKHFPYKPDDAVIYLEDLMDLFYEMNEG